MMLWLAASGTHRQQLVCRPAVPKLFGSCPTSYPSLCDHDGLFGRGLFDLSGTLFRTRALSFLPSAVATTAQLARFSALPVTREWPQFGLLAYRPSCTACRPGRTAYQSCELRGCANSQLPYPGPHHALLRPTHLQWLLHFCRSVPVHWLPRVSRAALCGRYAWPALMH